MTIEGPVPDGEDPVRVGVRSDLLEVSRYIHVPQIDVATVVRRPVLIWIVEAHLPAPRGATRAAGESLMDVEETIRRALVETATVVPWIGDQVLYPDEIDHEAD